MKHLRDLPVLVLGLGDSGLAMARWCARNGATVRVWDSRAEPPQHDALGKSGAFFSGSLLDAAAALGDARLVLKSPGLARHDARIAPVIELALQSSVPVQGELDLFIAALADLKAGRDYRPQLVAITGTNGKTTTTAMAARLIERAGKRVAAAGNIGPSLLATLAQALDDEAVLGHLPEVWVLELSSFQLDGVQGFEPAAATVLNLTQDHLDWHASMEAYAAAKQRVFGTSAVMVVNRDDPAVIALLEQPALPETARKSRWPAKPRKIKPRQVVRFGLDAPALPGDYGLVNQGGMTWLVRAHQSAERKALDTEIHLQHLMPADALRVRGRHNAANALAALALASAIGCALAPMLHALREYRGEPHRVEFIATVGGVHAYDDSKGTNVGATVAAINGLGDELRGTKLVVILGGDGKGQDFAPLVEPLQRHARAVATLGRDAARIEEALVGSAIEMRRSDTLAAATRWAFSQASSGDAVLLSPACSSLDMFSDYKQRAEVFVAEVRAIASERGECFDT